MKQEPFAWLHKPSGMLFDEIITSVNSDDLIPLYTAPKELSDKEIDEVYRSDIWYTHPNSKVPLMNRFKFARAILKKASEK